jgi:hypothetical protein
MNRWTILLSMSILAALPARVSLAQVDTNQLPTLSPGHVAAQNALWIENDPRLQFKSSKRVVVAEIQGPATITMIHFALPASQFTGPNFTKLNRDLLLKIYWDGEKEPSVNCPFVDFFCDPAGLRDEVSSALVNKRRGWNAYFPMPFRKSARVELVYDGPIPPGDGLWAAMPAYSYVMYRTMDRVPETSGYFHAHWRQETVQLTEHEYLALDAKGKGKFIGWNVTVRHPRNTADPSSDGYPVDENEKFFIDGEKEASVEFQGLEDSFGFSWGFPETQNAFPWTGYFPFMKGACAYRFFVQDSISFEKSLRVVIGFGKHEDPMFYREFSKPENQLQFSSVVYWYQVEPHAAMPEMPPAAERAPAAESPVWPHYEKLPDPASLKQRGVRLLMLCGRPEQEVVFAEKGFSAVAKQGNAWSLWPWPVYHCRSSAMELDSALEVEVQTPPGAEGMLRLFVLDPDSYGGGRKQTVSVAGKSLGTIEQFQKGRWLECPLTRQETAQGKVTVRAVNARQGSNAVLSTIEWVEKK